MTRVKICGITNIDDARAAVDAGADALGFIAVKNSPRYVDFGAANKIAWRLPPLVHCVAVGNHIADTNDYDFNFFLYTQYYADVEGYARRKTGFCLIRAFRIRDEASLRELADYQTPCAAVLLDTYHKDKLGGSGESFDWNLAVEAKKLTDRPIVLAGGLTPENVMDALEIVRPYAVDVSSGVERSPGVKDHAKVRAFVRAVRAWDLRQG